MSILLEALRQKSREAAQKSESTSSTEVSSSLSRLDQPTKPVESQSLDALVHELHIQPPQDFDWQLSATESAVENSEVSELGLPTALALDENLVSSADHELELLFPAVTTDEQAQKPLEPVLEMPISSLSLLEENRLIGNYDLSHLPDESIESDVLLNKEQNVSWLLEEGALNLVASVTESPAPLLSDIEQTIRVEPLESDIPDSSEATATVAMALGMAGGVSALSASEQAAGADDAKRYLGLSKQAKKTPSNESLTSAVAADQTLERNTISPLIAQRKVKLKPKWQVRKEFLWALPVFVLLPIVGYWGMGYYLAMQQSLTSQLASMQVDMPQEVAESAVSLVSSSDRPADQALTTDQPQVPTPMTEAEGLPAPVIGEKQSLVAKQIGSNSYAQVSEKPQRLVKPIVKEMPLPAVSARSAAGLDAIVISRAPSIDSILQDAWLAWQQKDVAQAESLYRQVLERQPSQRDALIGMMAIYQYRDMPVQARDVSSRLVQLYPYDREVKSLVSQFEKTTTTLDSRETQLKIQLQSNPNDASIIYQLGIHYASLQRWSEAQHMFARASQIDDIQAEYFANLAISLDHLGKREPAISAYQRAIQLAQTRPTGVNIEALTQRLSALLD